MAMATAVRPSGLRVAPDNRAAILSSLLGDLYATVTEPDRWQQFLVNVSHAMLAKSALLRIEDARMSRVVFALQHGLDPALQEAYRRYYIKVDPYVEALKVRRTGVIYPGDEVMPYRDLVKTEYFADYMRLQNNHFVAGGCIQRDEHFTIQFALQRERFVGPFHKPDVEFLQMLVPHMQRALDLQKLVGFQSNILSVADSALERLSIGMLLLNDHAGLEYANPLAESLLQAQRGIRLIGSRVAAVDERESKELHRLIDEARLGTSGRPAVLSSMLLSESGHGERNLYAVIYPVRRNAESFRTFCLRAAVALYIGPVENRIQLNESLLGSLYGLTPAESRLAVELANGREMKDIAARFEVSLNTLKTQLKSVFRKTGTGRQQGLVRLLAGGHWSLGE